MIQKLKFVFHWIKIGIKATTKLIQTENNLFCIPYSFIKKLLQDARSIHRVTKHTQNQKRPRSMDIVAMNEFME